MTYATAVKLYKYLVIIFIVVADCFDGSWTLVEIHPKGRGHIWILRTRKVKVQLW